MYERQGEDWFMTNKEILQKAIEKVKENSSISDGELNLMSVASEIDFWNNKYHTLIFSHDFAKAFWGKDKCICSSGTSIPLTYKEIYNDDFREEIYPLVNKLDDMVYMWEFHLQQMILEKEPLRYLEKFL